MALAENLDRIRARIAIACDRSGRTPDTVELMAVSKNHPPSTIAAAASLGLQLFGESRVQEARLKIPQLPGRFRWHLIGHLQSNKCRDAVGLFSMVQSVDSLPLAQELSRCAAKQAKTLPILLEVNIAGEASKFGWQRDQVLTSLDLINALPKLEIHGLMTLAPYSTDPERARPVFRALYELKRECEQQLGARLPVLSMGMSGDMEVAVEEGSTLIRVGTALFGERPKLQRQPDGA